MGSLENDFIPPPECPIFEPSIEEFEEPLKYIAKIRSVAEKYGICKIKPPANWQPPFAVDVENFKFTPRIQRLNELEASTRIRLNFLDKIAKFWNLQGAVLKIPHVEKRILDLHALYEHVKKEGGLEVCNTEKKWGKIAAAMDYPQCKTVCNQLRHHYERILHPYDVFRAGASVGKVKMHEDDADKKDKDYIPHGIASRQALQPPDTTHSRRSKRAHESPSDALENVDYSTNNELRKLQFYGAGPKMPGYCPKASETKQSCIKCGKPDFENHLLMCLKCGDFYHLYCLNPPLNEIPRRVWRCPKCVAEEVSKPEDAFGFEQSQKEYTLQEFGHMADSFKASYFRKEPHLVPTSEVEKEFWKIVGAVDNDVTVQYGADLHTIDHGSGFPTKNNKDLTPEEKVYAESGWNLNVLPVLEGSIFKYINADISGMKVPWMYVGMCFATFCWHNEDHWSYSINYLHWGEPKTWYGVPGPKAEKFESAMKSAAPELFENQPDLLHQLVTIMNPNILMASGVPIVRTNQHAGEFVITFPRSYHAGFNQGYNFAEAVNFAPADWLSIGRACVQHYSLLHRFCVFSHDELICTMAMDPEQLDVCLAAATYHDMLKMVMVEKNLRLEVWKWVCGVDNAEQEKFEAFPDDERQCDYCKTTCFLSALTCSCNPKKLVCLAHKDRLCPCPPSQKLLKYRYALDELPPMLQGLKKRAESFDRWAAKANKLLDSSSETKSSKLDDLKELYQQSVDQNFPENEIFFKLKEIVDEAEKCTELVLDVLEKKNSLSEDDITKYSIAELESLCKRVDALICDIDEAVTLKEYLSQALECRHQIQERLQNKNSTQEELKPLLMQVLALNVDFPEIELLKERVEQVDWLHNVSSLLKTESYTMEKLQHYHEEGTKLMSTASPTISMRRCLSELNTLLANGHLLDQKAQDVLKASPKPSLFQLKSIIAESQKTCPFLRIPGVVTLKDIVKKVEELEKKIKEIENSNKTFVSEVEKAVARLKALPVPLEGLPMLQSKLESAWHWKEKAIQLFVKGNSSHPLLELLTPRNDGQKVDDVKMHLDYEKNYSELQSQYRFWSQREIETTRKLRAENASKWEGNCGNVQYCICSDGKSNNMLECQLCSNWFHVNCVLAPKAAAIKHQEMEGILPLTLNPNNARKFLCPRCLRTRRPTLQQVESLLRELLDLTVRIPEGEALLLLHDRILGWQDHCKTFMQISEIKARLHSLKQLDFNIENASEDLSLSEGTSKQLSELLLEGDLLEVTLPELSQLWSLQLASKPPDLSLYSKVIPFIEEDCEVGSEGGGPCKKRKLLNSKISEKVKTRIKLACLNDALKPIKKQESSPPKTGPNKQDVCQASPCLHPSSSSLAEGSSLLTCQGGCQSTFHPLCVGRGSSSPQLSYTCSTCSSHSSVFQFIQSLKKPTDLLTTSS